MKPSDWVFIPVPEKSNSRRTATYIAPSRNSSSGRRRPTRPRPNRGIIGGSPNAISSAPAACTSPLRGSLSVSQNLDQLYRDEREEQRLQAARLKAEQLAKVRYRRARYYRRWR